MRRTGNTIRFLGTFGIGLLCGAVATSVVAANDAAVKERELPPISPLHQQAQAAPTPKPIAPGHLVVESQLRRTPIEGRVVDPFGRPVAGATVVVRRWGELEPVSRSPSLAHELEAELLTDDDGRFFIPLQAEPGQYIFRAVHPDYPPGETAPIAIDAQPTAPSLHRASAPSAGSTPTIQIRLGAILTQV